MKLLYPRAATASALLVAGVSMLSVGASAQMMPTTSAPPVTHTTDFGPACSAVPKAGAGSFSGMTKAPVATAASHNPVLSTLVAAVEKAGLADTLNTAKGLTVFAGVRARQRTRARPVASRAGTIRPPT